MRESVSVNLARLMAVLLTLVLMSQTVVVSASETGNQDLGDVIDHVLLLSYTDAQMNSLMSDISSKAGRAITRPDLVIELELMFGAFTGDFRQRPDADVVQVFFEEENVDYLEGKVDFILTALKDDDLFETFSLSQANTVLKDTLTIDKGAALQCVGMLEEVFVIALTEDEVDDLASSLMKAFDDYVEGEGYRVAGDNVAAGDAYLSAKDELYDCYQQITAVKATQHTELLTNYGSDDYIELTYKGSGILEISGNTQLNKPNYAFQLKDDKGIEKFVEFNSIARDGSFDDRLDLSEVDDGDYIYTIYYKKAGDVYHSYHYRYPLTIKHGHIIFKDAYVYDHNVDEFDDMDGLNPADYTDIGDIYFEDEAKRQAIIDLAEDVTAGASDDAERLMMIHDYVATEIYYDHDSLNSGVYGANDAYSTWTDKKAVCQGYAELTRAMLRGIGIPALLVGGRTAQVTSWEDGGDGDHAWNAAFIDGEWILLDTTWDSGNKYLNGEYHEGDLTYAYYNQTLEMHSYDHKIRRVD